MASLWRAASAWRLASAGAAGLVPPIRLRAGPGDVDEPTQAPGNRRLEAVWTAVPILTLAVLALLILALASSAPCKAVSLRGLAPG
jgi:hypothetical protein